MPNAGGQSRDLFMDSFIDWLNTLLDRNVNSTGYSQTFWAKSVKQKTLGDLSPLWSYAHWHNTANHLPDLPLCQQSKDKTILYAVAATLVNCTNSYDKKEILPELVQLAKFSKQHVPEVHPKVRGAEGFVDLL